MICDERHDVQICALRSYQKPHAHRTNESTELGDKSRCIKVAGKIIGRINTVQDGLH